MRDRPDTRSYTWSDSSWTCNNWHSLQSLAVQHCCFWQPDQRGKIVTRLGDSVIERQTCVNSDPDSDAICKIKVFISRNLHHTIDEIKINNIPEPKALLISIKYVFMATSAGVGFCIIFNFSVRGLPYGSTVQPRGARPSTRYFWTRPASPTGFFTPQILLL